MSSAKPRPANTSPTANLAGYEGSCLPIRIHSQANTGARITISTALTDCHHDEGQVKPKIELFVLRSANSVRVDPACSKMPQNTDAPQKSTKIVISRARSAFVHSPARNSLAKKP